MTLRSHRTTSIACVGLATFCVCEVLVLSLTSNESLLTGLWTAIFVRGRSCYIRHQDVPVHIFSFTIFAIPHQHVRQFTHG